MQIFTDEALINEFKDVMRYLDQSPGNHYVQVIYGSKSEDQEAQVTEPKEGPRLHLSHLSLVPKPATDPDA